MKTRHIWQTFNLTKTYGQMLPKQTPSFKLDRIENQRPIEIKPVQFARLLELLSNRVRKRGD